MASSRNLKCFLVLGSSIMLCLSQFDAAASVGEQPDLLLCPQMQQLPDATLLSMNIWSPMASIDVLTPAAFSVSSTLAPLFRNTAIPTIPPDEMATDRTNFLPPPKQFQTQSFVSDEMQCFNFSGSGEKCYTKAAVWSTTFFPWPPKNERVLSTPDGTVIAKITNPGILGIPYPLDTSQEVYNCNDVLVGRIVWKFEWSQLFSPGYADAKIQDADGDDIGKIVTTSTDLSFQKNIEIQSSSGIGAAKMQHRFDGLTLANFEMVSKVTVQIGLSAGLSPPATESYFMAIVFANQLAGGLFWGPVFTFLFLLTLCCCSCGACAYRCRGCCKRESREAKVNPEETHGLLGEVKKVEDSMFACCSRYSNKKTATGQPPTLATHMGTEFQSWTSGKK